MARYFEVPSSHLVTVSNCRDLATFRSFLNGSGFAMVWITPTSSLVKFLILVDFPLPGSPRINTGILTKSPLSVSEQEPLA